MPMFVNKVLLLLVIFLPSIFSGNKSKAPDFPTEETETAPKPFALLPPKLAENSGMVYDRGILWTITDSGGPNILYGINLNGEIVAEATLKGASNIDWEDIAQDENYFYIADSGKNIGNRRNLNIYKVAKKQIRLYGKQEVEAQKIHYSYPDQVDFTAAPHAHSFDCEAIIAYSDSLYLLTKDWVNNRTNLYSLPKTPGNFVVSICPVSFDSRGLLTGADITPDGKHLFLIGYSQFKPFAWVINDFNPVNFSSWKITYVELSGLSMAQTEGIAYVSSDTILFSCERTPVVPEQLFLLPQLITE